MIVTFDYHLTKTCVHAWPSNQTHVSTMSIATPKTIPVIKQFNDFFYLWRHPSCIFWSYCTVFLSPGDGLPASRGFGHGDSILKICDTAREIRGLGSAVSLSRRSYLYIRKIDLCYQPLRYTMH